MLDNRHIFIVDDDEVTRLLLAKRLESMSCTISTASSGGEALEMLRRDDFSPDAIVLDRIMDDLDGLDMLEQIKRHPDLVNIPVIMLTSMESEEDIQRGIKAGVYQYLIKPVNAELFISSIHNALSEGSYVRSLLDDLQASSRSLGLMQESYFIFRTPEEAKNLALLLAACFPDPESVVTGLMELMMNAIEHGNLAISYDEKRQFLKDRCLHDEWERRLLLPEYKHRKARVAFYRTEDYIKVNIRDEGAGFDWKNFLENQEKMLSNYNGRGISLAKYVSFDEMDYKGAGNEVEARVFVNKDYAI